MAGQPLFCVPLDLGSITASSAVDGHPASHLNRHRSVGLTWNAGSSSRYCRGDFGGDREVDFCAILLANAQAGTTFRLRLGDSEAEVNGVADYDSGAQTFISPSITRRDGLYNSFWRLPASETKRYWQINIDGHSGDFEAAFLVMGKAVQPSRFYNYDHESGVEDLGRLEWTRLGVPDHAPGLKFRRKEFTLDWVTTAEWENEFRPMAEAVGTTEIVYVCFDPEAGPYRQAKTLFGRFQKPIGERARRIPTKHGLDFEILSMI